MAKLVLYGPDTKYGAIKRARYGRYVWHIVGKEKDEAGKWRTFERSTGCGLGEKVEAERKLGEYLISRRDPRPSGPRDPAAFAIADALSLYMTEHAPHVAAPKRIGYAVARLLPFWGGSMVGDITGNTCRGYVKSRCKDSLHTAATARRELAVLRAAARHCEREGYLTRAPNVQLPAVRQKNCRVYSRQELAAIIRSARREPRCKCHLAMFILLAAYTGKRSAAIRSLQWRPNTDGDGWVDVEAGMIHWGYSGTKKRRGDPTPIPKPLLVLLRLRARRGGKYVLTTPYSGGKASGPFKTAWKSALARAGVPHGRMHDLRHTAASNLLCRGVPDWLAAKYLGMSVETLRRTYGHLIPGALDGAAKAVGGK